MIGNYRPFYCFCQSSRTSYFLYLVWSFFKDLHIFHCTQTKNYILICSTANGPKFSIATPLDFQAKKGYPFGFPGKFSTWPPRISDHLLRILAYPLGNPSHIWGDPLGQDFDILDRGYTIFFWISPMKCKTSTILFNNTLFRPYRSLNLSLFISSSSSKFCLWFTWLNDVSSEVSFGIKKKIKIKILIKIIFITFSMVWSRRGKVELFISNTSV